MFLVDFIVVFGEFFVGVDYVVVWDDDGDGIVVVG